MDVEIGTVGHMWIDRECKEGGKLRVHSIDNKKNAVVPNTKVVAFPNTWQAYFQVGVPKKVVLNKLKKAMLKDAMENLMKQIKFIQELESLSE